MKNKFSEGKHFAYRLSIWDTLTITTPFYNSEEHIELYFEGLLKVDYPKSLLNLVFADNESTDNTYKMISKFLKKHRYEYNAIKFMKVKRIPGLNMDGQITHVMNVLMQESYPTDIVNVDSDVVLGSDDLWKLLVLKRSGADIATGLVLMVISLKQPKPPFNEQKIVLVNALCLHGDKGDRCPLGHYGFKNDRYVLSFPQGYCIVNCCGFALCLITRKIMNVLRCVHDPDWVCDQKFTAAATSLGFRVAVDPRLIINHLGKGLTPTCKYQVILRDDKVYIETNVSEKDRKLQRFLKKDNFMIGSKFFMRRPQ